MAQVTLRASATTAFTAATSVVCAKPTGTVDDDVMWATITCDDEGSGIGTITVPSGWTEIDRNASGNARLYQKRAASEGADYTWSSTLTQGWRVIISAWYNAVTTGDFWEPSTVPETTGTDATIEHASVTVSRDLSELVLANRRAGNDAVTDYGGTTLVVKVSAILQTRKDVSAGASGVLTVTFANSAAWSSWMVALMPPASATVRPRSLLMTGMGS